MKLVAIPFLFLALSAFTAHADAKPQWGKVICEAVPEADAVAFATSNHFLDNWDTQHEATPPYVAPRGTIACTLPVQFTSDTDSTGHTFMRVSVQFIDAPFKPAPCTVIYYDHSRTRHFSANGAGDGFADLVDGSPGDFNVSFIDNDQSKYESDEFNLIDVGRTPKIDWAGEWRDDEPRVPILSNCHLDLHL
jgi:hypothetical protein